MRKTKPAYRTCLPISQWPATDQSAWQIALTENNPLSPNSAASGWSPATLRKIAAGYGRYLAWLDAHDALDPWDSIANRISHERLATYLEDLSCINRGHTPHNRIQELGNALRALAPDQDWRWIGRAAGRLRASAIPARDKRTKIRPIDELFHAGDQAMNHAETAAGFSRRRRALLFRDGLMVAFLSFHPLRLKNFADLRLERHIKGQDGQLLLSLTASETKSGRPYEAPLAPLLTAPFVRYLKYHRPALISGCKGFWVPEPDALWISAIGGQLSAEVLSKRIVKLTGRSGAPLSPHLFRTCAATTIALYAPEAVDIVPAVLGHAGPEVSERYYNLAGSVEASRRYNSLLTQIRSR